MDKVDGMRKELVKAVEDWVGILKNHLLSTLGFEEVNKSKAEMERLKEEVHMLQQSLATSGQPSVVKKIFQIDSDKLEEGYSSMFLKFKELSHRSDFDINVNWKDIIKSIETNIVIKTKHESIQEHDQIEEESKPVSKNPSTERIHRMERE